MSVKRYDFDCITSDYLLGASLDRAEVADGDYVLYSDYAALLARHNALREAVAKERKLDALCKSEFEDEAKWKTAYLLYESARAEVDRLMGEE